jgi:serine/threonine-protein kinase
VIGKTISHYKILEKRGQGGMGIVYKALDTKLNRTVALKFLPPHLTEDESVRQRFMVEAQAASALDHPNICTIHEINETPDGQLYICMAYYEGESLRQKIDAGGLSFENALNIFAQIAQGLQVTHENNIIHRDIKPGNILLTDNGDVKIADFGLAKLSGVDLTKSTISKGTAAYMCPEQIRGGQVDFRCDIWALGIILYEMLTGHLPFTGDYPEPMMYAIVNEEPTPLSQYVKNAPESLQAILDKMLKKDPAERYHSVAELLHDAKPLLHEHKVSVKRRITTRPIRRDKKTVYPYILFSVVVGVILFLIFGFLLNHKRENLSIAVLPFQNFTNNTEDFFTNGMTSDLITELQKISALRVISLTSVMQYKKEPKPLYKIAEELNIDVVVETSVQRDEEHIHITTKLIQAVPEKTLWSGAYERQSQDVLTLQKEIARQVANELHINLTLAEEANLALKKTVNPEAYELYLQGHYFMNNYFTQQSIQKGIDCYLLAIEKDSTFAQAYAGLSMAYIILANYALSPPHEAFPKAKNYAKMASELDETLADVHAALGIVKMMYDWDWAGAEASFKRAITLNSGSAFAYSNYSWFLIVRRRFVESITNAEKARDLNPLSLTDKTLYAERLLEAGRYDEGIELLIKVLDSDPEFAYARWMLGIFYEQKNMLVEAVHHFQKAVDHSGGMTSIIASLGHAYAIFGKKNEANNILNELLELSKEKYISSYDIAVIYAGLGETEKAMAWLEKAFEQRDGYIGGWLNIDPRWNILRSDKRFITLLKEIGFK